MSNFYIWNPSKIPDSSNSISLVLINGDITREIAIDNKFANHLLKDIGVEGSTIDWTTTPYRSLYFSEYLGEEDWRDNWPIIWKVIIETDMPIQLNSTQIVPWSPTDANGDNWQKISNEDPVGCLVVSDFKLKSSLQRVKDILLSDTKIISYQEDYQVGTPDFSQIKTLVQHEQLHIDLGMFSTSFFKNGANYALHVMNICQQEGGSIHHETPPK